MGFEHISEDLSGEIFNLVDTNQDGIIDYLEFSQAMRSYRGKPASSPQQLAPPKLFELGAFNVRGYVRKDDVRSQSLMLALELMLHGEHDVRELTIAQIESKEFGRVNPRHQAPVLVARGSFNEIVYIHELLAILTYLALKFPSKQGAFPPDSVNLSKTLTRLSESKYLLGHWTELQGDSKSGFEEIEKELKYWDDYVEGDFLLGNDFSMVDAAILPILHWFYKQNDTSLNTYPKLKSVYENYTKHSLYAIVSPTSSKSNEGTLPKSLAF